MKFTLKILIVHLLFYFKMKNYFLIKLIKLKSYNYKSLKYYLFCRYWKKFLELEPDPEFKTGNYCQINKYHMMT